MQDKISYHPMPGETAIVNYYEGKEAEIPGKPGESDGKVDHHRVAYAVITGGVMERKTNLSLPGRIQQLKAILRIHHIYTDPKRRREGFAQHIIEAIKKMPRVEEIYSEAFTKEGGQLLEACGFKAEEGIYVWRR